MKFYKFSLIFVSLSLSIFDDDYLLTAWVCLSLDLVYWSWQICNLMRAVMMLFVVLWGWMKRGFGVTNTSISFW